MSPGSTHKAVVCETRLQLQLATEFDSVISVVHVVLALMAMMNG